jgi:hypothetical protein
MPAKNAEDLIQLPDLMGVEASPSGYGSGLLTRDSKRVPWVRIPPLPQTK